MSHVVRATMEFFDDRRKSTTWLYASTPRGVWPIHVIRNANSAYRFTTKAKLMTGPSHLQDVLTIDTQLYGPSVNTLGAVFLIVRRVLYDIESEVAIPGVVYCPFWPGVEWYEALV